MAKRIIGLIPKRLNVEKGFCIFGNQARGPIPESELSIELFDVKADSVTKEWVRVEKPFLATRLVILGVSGLLTDLNVVSFQIGNEEQLIAPVPAQFFGSGSPVEILCPAASVGTGITIQLKNYSGEDRKVAMYLQGQYEP